MEKRHILVIAALFLLMAGSVVGAAVSPEPEKVPFGDVANVNTTADHSKFKELQGEFHSGPEVTRACLSCHTEAASQVQKTIHWTWLCPAAKPEAKLGKAGYVVNNFCININSNEPRCTSCHAGYGWKDKNFDFTAQDRVDCLVCHEQTGSYKKFPTMAGNVVTKPTPFMGKTFNPPDWNKVAQSVSRPTRKNCGTCHFYGGGGEGVKHGDLDGSLLTPKKDLDVHMNAAGENFNCTRCHTTEAHKIAGRCYKSTTLTDRRSLLDSDKIHRITCYSCHSEKPHPAGSKANDHTDKVACQTCHIPEFAREHSTKMYWDWSTAGKKDENGKPFSRKKDGRPVYDTKKGDFRWEKNVKPEYRWFNGKLNYITLADTIDPSAGPVKINTTTGSYDDPHSRIFPFKVHRGKQPYDPELNKFVVPHLFGKDKTAYWKNYNWEKAVATGQEYVGLPFSGKVGFVDTEYMFQTTHMVAPKEMSLDCAQCHVKKDGRLASLTGFYVPARDANKPLDMIGLLIVILSLAGVLIHGAIRLVSRK